MGKKFDEILERLLNLPDEEKARLARLAGEAYGRRRTRKGTQVS